MCGRGRYSGLDTIKQITVNMDGNNVTYRSEKGKTWRIGNGNSVEDTVPMTLKEIENRAKKAGYSVKPTPTKNMHDMKRNTGKKERKQVSSWTSFGIKLARDQEKA